MSINKYNSEWYPDPTPYEALTRMEKQEKDKKKAAYKPLVYICSPYSGDVRSNTKKARRYSRFAIENRAIPLTPHLLFPQFLDDANPAERELAMRMNMVLLGKCSELWVFGGSISQGMAAEIARAKKWKMIIRYFTEQMEEVTEL